MLCDNRMQLICNLLSLCLVASWVEHGRFWNNRVWKIANLDHIYAVAAEGISNLGSKALHCGVVEHANRHRALSSRFISCRFISRLVGWGLFGRRSGFARRVGGGRSIRRSWCLRCGLLRGGLLGCLGSAGFWCTRRVIRGD